MMPAIYKYGKSAQLVVIALCLSDIYSQSKYYVCTLLSIVFRETDLTVASVRYKRFSEFIT